jgi:hypothetical protein
MLTPDSDAVRVPRSQVEENARWVPDIVVRATNNGVDALSRVAGTSGSRTSISSVWAPGAALLTSNLKNTTRVALAASAGIEIHSPEAL